VKGCIYIVEKGGAAPVFTREAVWRRGVVLTGLRNLAQNDYFLGARYKATKREKVGAIYI
jgi:hypothetical protein